MCFASIYGREKSIGENDICTFPTISCSSCEMCQIIWHSRCSHDDLDYHLIDGLALKDNDQCGRYYVNDLADVSKMRLRVAGYPRDRFVITTTVCEFGEITTYRTTYKQRERKRVCWSSDLLYTTGS